MEEEADHDDDDEEEESPEQQATAKGSEFEKGSQFAFSTTVRNAVERIGTVDAVSAANIAQTIFATHADYAGRKVAFLTLEDTPANRSAEEWLQEIQTVFDFDRMREIAKSNEPPRLHGRLVVIGLSLLEPELRKQLDAVGAFDALIKEVAEPWPSILSDRGHGLYESYGPEEAAADSLDSVPNWPDDPLLEPEQDLLGRRAFARFLAKRIAAIPTDSGAYSIHVYGPWGAGKSTLLNFLRKELMQPQPNGKDWQVVEFNAWRQQQIQPPWWSLMERIFQATKARLSFWERLQEYWWRLTTGRLQYIAGVILLAWLLVWLLPLLLSEGARSPLPSESAAPPQPSISASPASLPRTSVITALGASAKNLSEILALLATIWGGIIAVNRSLLLGAARAAQNYTDLTQDPTNEIKTRFNGLIKKLRPERVAILIDDLDRCQSRYVVDLLEGIQTLFREAPVVFVVSADRHWLNACYAEVYEKLEPRIHEPGKPLGILFLEKAFRFSTPMPGIPAVLKEAYWEHLLRLKPAKGRGENLDTERQAAKKEVTAAKSESDVRQLVEGSRGRSFTQQRALREEAVVRLAAPEVLQRIEHTLQPYAHLLEPNPRAMKLLVNGYSANRALTILSEIDVDLHQLALWTILSARWPQLADYLVEHPDMLKGIAQQASEAFPADLKPLCEERTVVQIAKGSDKHDPLSRETIEHCAQMHA